MNIALATVLFVLSLIPMQSYAEDGIVYQFKIMQLTDEGEVEKSYTNAVLMRFEEDVSLDLAEMYRLRLETSVLEGTTTHVVATLELVEKGRPFYIGAKQRSFVVGESFDLAYERYGSNFVVQLRTSYGKIAKKDL